jgi:hypothetical protein
MTRAEAFKTARAWAPRHNDGSCGITVFDSMAHNGKADHWRFENDGFRCIGTKADGVEAAED